MLTPRQPTGTLNPSDMDCQLFALMRAHGPQTIRSLAALSGANKDWIGKRLPILAEAGYLSRAKQRVNRTFPGGGTFPIVYSLTDKPVPPISPLQISRKARQRKGKCIGRPLADRPQVVRVTDALPCRCSCDLAGLVAQISIAAESAQPKE